MPYPNEHSARIKSPSGFIRFRRENNKFGQGIHVIWGVKEGGKAEVQAIRFSRTKFTVAQAKAWLKEHDYKVLEFEAASGKTDEVDHLVRWDRAVLRQKPVRTPEGFLKADATATRTGVFSYRNADGSLRKELRHPDDVLDGKSINSMKLIPVTDRHPPERLVTTETARYYQIGATGENIRPDGQYVICPLVVTDGDAIRSIEQGRNQVSLGYEVDLVPEQGKYKGEAYDFRQTNIRYNHLALVDEARAGDEAIIHLDAQDAVLESEFEPVEPTGGPDPNPTPPQQEDHMGKFNIDGIAYEAAQEVINFATRQRERADKAELDLTNVRKDLETVTGERDGLKAEKEKWEKTGQTDAIDVAVKLRRDIERKAEPILKDVKDLKLDEMTNRDVMEKVITKVHPDTKLDGKSDEYVQARFDAAVEFAGKADKAMSQTRKAVGTDSEERSDEYDVSAARERYVRRLENRGQDPKKETVAA